MLLYNVARAQWRKTIPQLTESKVKIRGLGFKIWHIFSFAQQILFCFPLYHALHDITSYDDTENLYGGMIW